jgi:hypothetical protein
MNRSVRLGTRSRLRFTFCIVFIRLDPFAAMRPDADPLKNELKTVRGLTLGVVFTEVMTF